MKKLKEGSVRVDMIDVDYESFSDMSFFEKYVPDGCELVQVQICYEVGMYDEPDEVWFSIEWKEKE
jgi:hypothetical protein